LIKSVRGETRKALNNENTDLTSPGRGEDGLGGWRTLCRRAAPDALLKVRAIAVIMTCCGRPVPSSMLAGIGVAAGAGRMLRC